MAVCYCSGSLGRIGDISAEINIVESEPVIVPNDPVINQPIETNVEIPLGRFQRIKKPALLDDCVYLHESDSNLVKPMIRSPLMKQFPVQTVITG